MLDFNATISLDTTVWCGKKNLALAIAIDDYRGAKIGPSQGCVNDLELLSEILRSKFDFGVLCLKDLDATRNNILAAMKALLDAAGEDSQVVLSFCGHGSQIDLGKGRIFETLVPCDSSRIGWSHNHDITDRELFGWVWRVSAKTPFLTLIIDACQAGGIVRDAEARARGATGETAGSEELKRDKSAFVMAEEEVAKPGPSGWLPVSDRYTLLAACRSKERSLIVVDPVTDKRQGLFSLQLAQALTRLQSRKTWRELFEEVAAAVTTQNPRQHPQLEGQVDRVVFGQEVFAPGFFLPILCRSGNAVTLGGGTAHGAHPQSSWSVHPAGSRRPGEDCCGHIQVQSVSATRAEAWVVWEPVPGAVAPGQRAFETSRPIDQRFRVLLAGAAGQDAELKKLVLRSPYLALMPGNGLASEAEAAEVVLHRLGPRTSCGDREPLPQLPSLDKASWAFVSPAGAQLAPLYPAAAKGAREQVVATLEKMARHRSLLNLCHPDARASLSRSVELLAFQILENEKGQYQSHQQLPELPGLLPGTRIGFELSHKHERPLQVTLISLGVNSSICKLFPVRGRFEPWPAEACLKIGFEAADALEITYPQGFPFPGEPMGEEEQAALLFLFTEQPEGGGFDLMAQEGLRAGGPKRSKASLADFALRMVRGSVLREDPAPDALADSDAWGLALWRYRLLPPR